jgi:hypothetical protein
MRQKHFLTHQEIVGKNESSFSLCNRAIDLARKMVESGQIPQPNDRKQNLASVVIDHIVTGKELSWEHPENNVAVVVAVPPADSTTIDWNAEDEEEEE